MGEQHRDMAALYRRSHLAGGDRALRPRI